MTDKIHAPVDVKGKVANQSSVKGSTVNAHSKGAKEINAATTVGEVTDNSQITGATITISDSSDIEKLKAELQAEIQPLLEQLAQNPITADQAVATTAIEQHIKKNPNLKQRLFSALKAGGIETLKAIFNHPAVTIPIETLKGFLEAS